MFGGYSWKRLVDFSSSLSLLSLSAGKSPFFPGLDDPSLMEDPNSAGQLDGVGVGPVGGLGMTGPQNPPLSSPSRSSPHSQGSETGERFSRKVFVGGLPPDIDEGLSYSLSFNTFFS